MRFYRLWPVHKYGLVHFAVVLLCLGISFYSRAQDQIRFQNYRIEDGLSMGTVSEIAKDGHGFAWVATAEGLHRFDGQKFQVFKHVDGDPHSLSDSYLTSLKYADGKLYVGNHKGTIDVFDVISHEVVTLDPTSVVPSFDYAISVLALYEDQLLVGTNGGGLWVVNRVTNELKPYNPGHSDARIITDIVTYGKDFYFSTEHNLYRANLDTCESVALLNDADITSLCWHEGQMYIGTTNGLFIDREKGFGVVQLPPRKRRVNVIADLLSFQGRLWVATHGGLVILEGEDYWHYRNEAGPYSLVDDQLSCLFVDNEDEVWLGTIAGFSIYAPSLKKFGLLQEFVLGDEVINNNVYYIYEDQHANVWLGTLSGGLLKLGKDQRIMEAYPIVSDGKYFSRSVRCVLQDSKGRFWIGTRDAGLFFLDERTKQFKAIRGTEGYLLEHNTIRAIFEDRQGRLWIGTDGGLYRYDVEENRFTNFKANPKSNSNNVIYQITQLPSSDRLILGSFRGGLQMFDPENEAFTVFKSSVLDSTSMSNNNVMSLEWMNKDTLLIGTYGGGLNIMDVRTQKFKHITEKDGLINNAVYGILYEGNGKIWMSTNAGVVLFDLYHFDFKNFNTAHYLQNKEFNEGAFCKTRSGEFYFGGVSGLNYFKPSEIIYKDHAPAIKLTGIRATDLEEINGQLRLNFLNSRLELDFMALYYANPAGVKYRYKMEGYDQDWVEPQFANTAVYPKLNPGRYTFIVEAKDEFGVWHSEPLKVVVFVSPPIWQRWWFIVLAFLLIAAGIYALFRARTRQIEKSYKLQLVDSELRALRSQMNPHFIFNSLNSIQYFILKKQPKDAYTYLSKFASLMRKILQNSRLKYISVHDEAEWLELYLEMESLRMDNTLDFKVDTSGIEDPEYCFIPTMLIQPYVENSIVHGLLSKETDRKINVWFRQKEDHVECEVLDNGIGREASRIMNEKRTRKHNSAGMALTKSRLQLLSEGRGNFDVRIEDLYTDGIGSGTRVVILIPIIEGENEKAEIHSH